MNEPKPSGGIVAKIPALLLLIFTLPFTAIGLRTAATAFGPLLEAVQMRGWTEVPAQLVTVDMDVHELRRGGPLYLVRARYRYTFAGTAHEGTRVSLIEVADSVGNYQQTTHARLRAALHAGQTVPCYVNPDNPGESILVREPRLDATVFLGVVALGFGGIGLLLGIGAALALAGRPISLEPLKRLGQATLPGAGRTTSAPGPSSE
jgi:hypothetical protein